MMVVVANVLVVVQIEINWDEKTIACVQVNAFCWANCNLSLLREINDVFKNQNEN